MPAHITPQDAPNDPVIVRLHGTVDHDDVNRVIDAIEAAIAQGPAIGLVIDMGDLEDASIGALARDARFELSMLSRLDRFARLALVGAPGWMNVMASGAGRLLPGVRVRAFDRGEFQPALAWVKQRDESESVTADAPASAGITTLPTANDNVIAFEIDGDITAEALSPLINRMLATYDRGAKVDLLVRVRRIGSVDWGLLTDERFRRMKLEGIGHIARYAIVGAPDWMEAIANLAGRATPIDIRTFDRDDEADAWNWLANAERKAA